MHEHWYPHNDKLFFETTKVHSCPHNSKLFSGRAMGLVSCCLVSIFVAVIIVVVVVVVVAVHSA